MIGWLRCLWESRRRRWHAIDADARALIVSRGELAYDEARRRAREEAPPGRARHPYHSAVASRIKHLTGMETGRTGADRYPGP